MIAGDATILAAAMLLDAALGEPRWLWARLPHPAVLIGRAVSGLEVHLNRGGARRARGIVALAVLVAGAGLAGAALAALGPLAEALVLAVLLAQRSLVDHVRAVARDLRMSLPSGRRAVALIVGRDTSAMTGSDVARAAIESAAENLSDGVIAPLLWYLLAGLPGVVIYKAVNTADSMIGHRTPRHAEFGWAAARADDLLNLLPARISAMLIAVLHGQAGQWRIIAAEARRHRSPNAGWPEAAMARALGVALSGPRVYHGRRESHPFVNPGGGRDIGAAEIDAACTGLWRVWGVALASSVMVTLVSG